MQPNPVSYVEIPVTDLPRAIRFYEAVFGYDLEQQVVDGHPMALFPAHDGKGITGALATGDSYTPGEAGARIYFHTNDIDATLARVVQHGGRILYPKKAVGEWGHVAEFADSEGNRIALSQPPQP